MNYRLSRHAEWQIERRQISRDWLDLLLDSPEQRILQSQETEIFQSRFVTEDGKEYLVRAVLATDKEPPLVVTVYQISKIDKYWRPQ